MDVTHGFVLAGGASVRMGQCKALVCYPDENPMVSTVLGVLAAACHTVAIVVKPGQCDERWPDGPLYVEEVEGLPLHPLSGVVCALSGLSVGQWAIFAPCDVPYLRVESVVKLIEVGLRTGRGAVAFDGHRVHPLIAMVPSHLVEDANTILRKGGAARDFVSNFERVSIDAVELRNINALTELST